MPTTDDLEDDFPSSGPATGWRGWTTTYLQQYTWARGKYGTYPDCRGRGASTVPRLPKMQAAGVLAWWVEGGQAEAWDMDFWELVDLIGAGTNSDTIEGGMLIALLGPAIDAVQRTTGDQLACVDANAFWDSIETAAREWDRQRVQKPASLKLWESTVEAIEKLPANVGAAAGTVTRTLGDAAGQFFAGFFGALGPFWIIVGLVVLAGRR